MRGALNRIVLLRFEDDTTEEQLRQVVERFKGLGAHLSGVTDIHAALNGSDKSKGYRVVLTIGFENEAALQAYETNEEHLQCSAFIRSVGRKDGIIADYPG